MAYRIIRHIGLFLWVMAVLSEAVANPAPSNGHGVEMRVTLEPNTANKRILTAVIELHNPGATDFQGQVRIAVPTGFSSISGDVIDVAVGAGSRYFTSARLFMRDGASAGEANIDFSLLNTQGDVLLTESVGQHVPEDNEMRLFVDLPIIYIDNPNDSLVVEATVKNEGNMHQNVAVVFAIPGLGGERNFFEHKGKLAPSQDTIFRMALPLTRFLLEQPQFMVHITGMRGAGKEIFDNRTVTVQNVASARSFSQLDFNTMAFSRPRNSLTASYRNMGDYFGGAPTVGMYRLAGGGELSLPYGYLEMTGYLFMAQQSRHPTVSNSSVAYHRGNNEFRVGNISEMLAISLHGRGASVSLANDSDDRHIRFGVIDQNFNLIGRTPLFQQGYGAFARGTWGTASSGKSTSAAYVFWDNRIETAKSHLFSAETKRLFNQHWNMAIKTHAAASHYPLHDILKPSFATEMQYSGNWEDTRLAGHYYYSTPYFPGNRRGVVQIQQNARKTLKNSYTLAANAFYSSFSPKYLDYPSSAAGHHVQLGTGLTLPRAGNWGFGFGYRYQWERTDGLALQIAPQDSETSMSLRFHGLAEDISWTSPNAQHSVNLGLENGIITYSDTATPKLLVVANTAYTYQWVNVNALYQYGSNYVSEHAMARLAQREFSRWVVSVAGNRKLAHDKMTLNAGLSYIRDNVSGETPSVFANLRYAPSPLYTIHFSPSWYRYRFRGLGQGASRFGSEMFTVEAGVTVNFRGRKPSKGKKGKVTTFVYYDKNANNVFDGDDEPAEGVMVTFDKTALKTDSEGKFVYAAVPFGTYDLNPGLQRGWFAAGRKVDVARYRTKISVPLHQSGTLGGAIEYQYDAQKSLEFEPRLAGVQFAIFRGDSLVSNLVTADNGRLMGFLPPGEYQVVLNERSLPENTFCEQKSQQVTIAPGQISSLPPFTINVREKQIRIRRFGD